MIPILDIKQASRNSIIVRNGANSRCIEVAPLDMTLRVGANNCLGTAEGFDTEDTLVQAAVDWLTNKPCPTLQKILDLMPKV